MEEEIADITRSFKDRDHPLNSYRTLEDDSFEDNHLQEDTHLLSYRAEVTVITERS